MPEQIKEVTELRGLNLRQETADLKDPETQAILNLDPFRTPGTLCIRKGHSVLGGPVGANPVRTLAKINAVRYQISGRGLYRDFALIHGDLSTVEKTGLISYRPLNDSVTWAFVADNDWMTKDDAPNERYFLWGIDKPLLPKPKIANQTGKDAGDTITAGTYLSAVTQLRFDPYVTLPDDE